MTDKRSGTVYVWDPLVRIFHWGLAFSFLVAWLSGDELGKLHHFVGYVALALIAVRLPWGLLGTKYARFTQFVRSPGTVADYLKKVLNGREDRYIGHNPAGGAMVVALILTMIATGVTGWMTTLDPFWGYKWVEELHGALANIALILVSLHVAGVAFASLRHRENLVRAMWSGRKRAPDVGDVA